MFSAVTILRMGWAFPASFGPTTLFCFFDWIYLRIETPVLAFHPRLYVSCV